MDMNNNQEYLKQGIFNYLKNLNVGALMVTGSWGCGKSYYFEHVLFEKLREKDYKPIRVSLFGMTALSDLPKNIICELAQYASDKGWVNTVVKAGTNALTNIKKLPVVSDYVELKGVFGERAIYRMIPDKTVVCLDDLERAVEKFDINDLLGVVNDLVENQHMKVIVIANKDYIDQTSDKNGEKGLHEIFYEKVIEKTLHFEPCILDVFAELVKVGDEKFQAFMLQMQIEDSVNPLLAASKRVGKQKENIRTLKFAVTHFKAVFDSYVEHGEDVADENVNRILVNQWMFLYAISLENKRDALSIDDYCGLDTYLPTADTVNIDLGEEDNNVFEEDDDEKKPSDVNMAKRFVHDYYGEMAMEYVFYPDIYRFVLGGINFDFERHQAYVQKAFERFEYKGNPAQGELDRWMKGYWTMGDDEATDSLTKLLKYVVDGQLVDFVSYYNASVFLLKCCELIGKSEEDVLTAFDEGLKKFAANVTLNAYMVSCVNVLPVEKNEPVGKVYDMIQKVIAEKQNEQKSQSIDEMRRLFSSDIEGFVQLFVPKGQNTPKFFNEAVLQILSEEEIHEMVDKAQPGDMMNLYYMVGLRYNNDLLKGLMDELPFISRLKEAVRDKAKDKTKLSSVIVHDQLLPKLEKVERRMSELEQNK